MRIILLSSIVFLACSFGCRSDSSSSADANGSPERPREGEFQGIFTYAFEGMDFQPDNSSEHWWLEGNEAFHGTIRQDCFNRKVNLKKEVPLYRMKLRGKLSPIGEHGHFGLWRRELTVDKILEYEYIGNKPLNSGNTP